MGFLDRFKEKASEIQNQFFGWAVSTQPVDGKLPVFPEWYFTARLGQPRRINVTEIRNFSQSGWVQMVLNTIKKESSIIDYDLVNVDSEDDTVYEEDIRKVKEKLQKINTNNENIYDLHSMLITDLGEIDAGVVVPVYTLNSYEEAEQDFYDAAGNFIETRKVLKLKPLGQREVAEFRAADGSTFLKQIDVYGRIEGYYQYSFKNPRTNPIFFEKDEVIYYQMNKKSYQAYGFSPVQSIQQVLELLIQSTRWNKDYFRNNAIPDGMIGLEGADPASLKKFKESVMGKFKGKPHQLLFHNTKATFTSFMSNAKDMEWLEGQKWYSHLVFGAFGVSPTEAGFHENVNQGNQAGQERITVKNGIKPYLELFERMVNTRMIPEILQQENPKIKFKYKPKEHVEEQIEFEQDVKMIELGALTVNEFRKSKGLTPVSWGDVPLSTASNVSLNDSDDNGTSSPQQDDAQSNTDMQGKGFAEKFVGFLNARH